MSVFTTSATASHRYYARKAKADLVRRVQDLEAYARLEPRTAENELRRWTRDQLASHAMSLHRRLPE
jgi:hypothetical protein